MWRMDSPTASPITATLHRPDDSATDLTNQTHPSTWMDGHESPTGSGCRRNTIAQVVCDEQKEDSKDSQIIPRLLPSLQGQDKFKGTISQKSFTARCSWPVDQNKVRQKLHLPLPLPSIPIPSRAQFHHFVAHAEYSVSNIEHYFLGAIPIIFRQNISFRNLSFRLENSQNNVHEDVASTAYK